MDQITNFFLMNGYFNPKYLPLDLLLELQSKTVQYERTLWLRLHGFNRLKHPIYSISYTIKTDNACAHFQLYEPEDLVNLLLR